MVGTAGRIAEDAATMTRPPELFPLFAEPTTLDGVGPKIAKLLGKLGVENPAGLLLTLPVAGVDRRLRPSVLGARLPEVVTVEVEIGMHQPGGGRHRPYRIHVRDQLTEFQLVFFHPRPDWLRSTFPTGQRRIVSGRIEIFDGLAQMAHPNHVLRPGRRRRAAGLRAGLSADRGVDAAAPWPAPSARPWTEHRRCRSGSSRASSPAAAGPTGGSALHAAHAPAGPADLAPTAPARRRGRWPTTSSSRTR